MWEFIYICSWHIVSEFDELGGRKIPDRGVSAKGMDNHRMIGDFPRTVLSVVVAMALSVMALSQTSEPEPSQGGAWHIETVDSGGSVGYFTSIDLDSNGYPHISYEGETALGYAKWTGTNWSIEVVDSPGKVRYTSIDLDTQNNPHISYYDQLNEDLKYSKWTGTNWSIETVDSAGDVGYTGTSIALDSKDFPHIAYHDESNFGLKYSRWDGNKWNSETVEAVPDVGEQPSIAIDSSDYPHISYYDSSNSNLKYARWNGTNWSIQVVDSSGVVGWSSSIALDSNDNPHISYHDHRFNYDLKYAKWNGTNWSIETVDFTGLHSGSTSLAHDSNDNPHIGYYEWIDNSRGNLKYAKWSGTNWSIEIADSDGDVGAYASIAIDINGYPHVSYFDDTNNDLKYATKAKLAQATRSITLDIDPDTLNLKSKGRWITAYLTTENAYADDIDALSLLLNDVIRPEWWDIQNNTTLMVKFDRAAVQTMVPVSDSVDIKVTGQWTNGESFEVHDTIRVINPGQ